MANITIQVKSLSNRLNKTTTITYSFEKNEMTLKDFLTKTAEKTAEEYNKGQAVEEILKCINCPLVDGKAVKEQVVDTMITCFEEKKLNVFYGETKCEDLEQVILFEEGIEVSFVRQLFTNIRGIKRI